MLTALIFAEIGGEKQVCWELVAHTIMNRHHSSQGPFAALQTVGDIISQPHQYSGYGSTNYHKAMDYFNNSEEKNELLENIMDTVLPIYYGKEADPIQGAQWYYCSQSVGNSNGSFIQANYDNFVSIADIPPRIIRFYTMGEK